MKALLAVLTAIALLAPQQQTFRSGVNVVPIYATVVDRTGRFVRPT
jgi:hypothetical protein